jgi:hypothetical protein
LSGGEVFHEEREMRLQPSEGLRSRVGDVALERIRIELARGVNLADFFRRQFDDPEPVLMRRV